MIKYNEGLWMANNKIFPTAEQAKSFQLYVIKNRHYTSPNFKFEVTRDTVKDGVKWYTVVCSKEIHNWLLGQDFDKWTFSNSSNPLRPVDIREDLYTMLVLKWK